MARSIEFDSGHRGGDIFAIALGASVLMWAVAYVGLSPAVNAPALPLAGFALLCLLGAGFALGWFTSGGGVKLGLALGLINFLVVASFHGRETVDEAMRFGVKWVAGFTIIAVGLCALGAAAGSRMTFALPDRRKRIEWTSVLAAIVAVALFPLLISGGIVTGLDAGLAVPDWLTTFDYPMMFYPLVAMQADGKVYAEHFHRLWGLLAGLSVILLAVQIHRTDDRAWLRWLSIAIILAVSVQGVLGAAWVLDTQLRGLAVMHGVFGQIVFAAVVATAAFTSRTWLSATGFQQSALPAQPRAESREPTVLSIDFKASLALFIMLLIQLGFGATYRHVRREALDATAGIHALWAHIILATILIGVIVFVAGRAWGVHREKPALPRLGKAMLHLLGLQLVLGVGALIVALKRGTSPEPFGWEIAVTTAHQAVGALMLAVAGLLVVWTRRVLT